MLYPAHMILELVQSFALTLPVEAAVPAVEGPCPGYYDDPCEGLEYWTYLAPPAVPIPADGVLVLQGAYTGTWDAGALATVDVTVTRDGTPVDGALELSPVSGTLLWRPSAPWVPGAHELSGAVTQSVPEECIFTPLPDLASTQQVEAAPAPALGVPVLVGSEEYHVEHTYALDTLACCEGSAPSIVEDGCGFLYLDSAGGNCAPFVGNGYLRVELDGKAPPGAPPGQTLAYRYVRGEEKSEWVLGPEFLLYDDAPFCATLEAMDLASGEIRPSIEWCFGDLVADKLGVLPIDVDLGTCEVVTCEPTATGWDPEKCTPFEPEDAPTTSDTMSDASDASDAGSDTAGEDGEKGCACDARGGGEAGLLGLLGLLGLRRRRRGRS